jgi:hypothetical protein
MGLVAMPAICKATLLTGSSRTEAIVTVERHHYAHSVSSGKTYWFSFGAALIAWSIPANNNVSKFLIGKPKLVWELSRLWAPDGHESNLLTQAIASSLKVFRQLEPSVAAVVSYADPNVGHEGGVYRAASWLYCGQCEEGRYYVDSEGQVVSRRKFHSGSKYLSKAEIEAKGFQQLRKPGKHRYAKGLCKWSRKELLRRFQKTV